MVFVLLVVGIKFSLNKISSKLNVCKFFKSCKFLFNSSIYDMYYRILNGSTQVNSTEVNVIPIPTMNVIETMGKELKLSNDLSESNCNNILNKYINGQTEND